MARKAPQPTRFCRRPNCYFVRTPRLPFAAGDSGHDLIDDDAANQRSSPGIDRKVASRREEPLFAEQQSSAGDAIEPSRHSIGAGRERKPSRDFDAQFSAMQTQRPAQTPDTPSSAGVAMRERRTDAAERRLESVARPDVAHLDAAGQERATKPVVPPTAAQTHATEDLEPARPSSTRRAALTSAYRPDAASDHGRRVADRFDGNPDRQSTCAAAGENCESREGEGAAAAGERSNSFITRIRHVRFDSRVNGGSSWLRCE